MGHDRSNIVLIGMPGAGKSTVGVILAKQTSRDFIDTDLLIQISEGLLLQEIVDTQGYLALRKIEEAVLLELSLKNYVIATGGSAAYSHAAMTHLKSDGVVVFLNADLATLRTRVHNFSERGIAKRPDQSFSELFEERNVLYRKYADITINCKGLTQEEVCDRIIREL
jgi:shikimate kinase